MANYNIDAIYNGNTSLPGTERVRIDSSGNIGIGTATPSTKLHIYENANRVTYISQNDNHTARFEAYGTATAIDTTASNGIFFRINSGDIVKFAADGNVGIGTSTAGAPLHIYRASSPFIRVHGGSGISYIQLDDGSNFGYLLKNSTSDTSNNALAGALYTYTAGGKAFQHIHGGTPLFTILSGGNVGIGTTSPGYLFTIKGGAAKIIGSHDNNSGIYLSSTATDRPLVSFRVSDDSERAKIEINNINNSNGDRLGFFVYSGIGLNERMSILGNGNVGIGSTAPNDKLDIVGRVYAYRYIAVSSNAASPAYATDTNTGMFNAGSNIIGFSISSAEKMRLNADGNLGIGTSSPAYKLEVNGNFAAGGTSTIGTTYPQLTLNGTTNQHAYLIINRTNYESGIQFQTSGTTKWWMYMPSGNDAALRFYTNQNSSGDILNLTNTGNVGIGTTGPNKKLQIIGSLGKGLNLYEVPIDNLGAVGTQAKRYEIARVFIDYNDWNNTGPVEIEVRESYYSDGRYKRYLFSYGYNSNNAGSLWLVEDAGRGANDFKAEVGSAVQVSGDIYYVPIYIDLDYYQYVDVLVRTNRPRTTNASSASGGVIYINESPTGSNISSFSPDEVTYISLASSKTYLGYSGNVGIGTSSPAQKLHIDTSTGTLATRDNGDGALWSTLSTSKTIGLSSGDNYAQSSNYSWMKITGGASGSIQFAVNSLTMTIVDGKVGIGTTSPASPLTAQSNANQLRLQTTSGPTSYFANIGSRYDSTRPFTIEVANGASTATEYFGIYADSGGANNRIALLNGNVGIGTTSPTSKLDVTGGNIELDPNQFITFNNAGTVPKIGYRTSGTQAGLDLFDNSGLVTISIGNQGVGIGDYAGGNALPNKGLAVSGNVGIGTTSPSNKLHVWTGTVQVSGFQSIAAGPLTFLRSDYNGSAAVQINFLNINASNGYDSDLGIQLMNTAGSMVDVLRIKGSSGNVGIGTTNPGAKLVVIGETQISSSSAYTTHLNYQDSGINFITMANSGYTDFRASSNNVTAMRIKGDGNVGVGTTSPTQRLHVLTTGGSTTAPNIVTTFQANTATTILAGGGTAIKFVGVSSGGNLQDYDQGMISTLGYADNNRHGMQFWVKPNASTVLTVGQTIDSNGNVGIGTTSPADKLSIVNGNISLSDSYKLYNGSAADSVGLFFSAALQVNISGYSGIIFRSSATNVSSQAERMRITSDGYVGIGTSSPTAYLHIYGQSGDTATIRLKSSNGRTFDIGSTGTSYGSANNFIIYDVDAAAERLRINSDGNVGIGTTSPITKLHVAGTASIIPTYDSGSGYSYFLRMGYDTSGSYDYTIKRNGTTGFLEFNGTQASTYVSYVFAGGDVYSGASGGTIGGFYFNSSSHGIRRATGTNDVYCFTTSGTLYLGAGGSSTTHVRVLSGGDVGIGVSPSYKLDVNGNIHGTGFPTSSDVRFKKNITPLQNSLEKIKKLQGVKYEWNEFVNSRRDGYKLNIPIIGLIAQDVEQVVPEIVDHWKLSEDCQDARSIDYPRLIPLLIEAMKEQQNQIEELRNEIKSLKSN